MVVVSNLMAWLTRARLALALIHLIDGTSALVATTVSIKVVTTRFDESIFFRAAATPKNLTIPVGFEPTPFVS